MKNNSLSQYGRTPINRSGYLDILKPRPVPINREDTVFDFVAGTKIFLPDPAALRNTLGF